jgi:hypothetical protein
LLVAVYHGKMKLTGPTVHRFSGMDVTNNPHIILQPIDRDLPTILPESNIHPKMMKPI